MPASTPNKNSRITANNNALVTSRPGNPNLDSGITVNNDTLVTASPGKARAKAGGNGNFEGRNTGHWEPGGNAGSKAGGKNQGQW